MSEKKNDPPESQSQVSADDSGTFSLDPKSMTPEMLPLLPLLTKSVKHMREGNEHQKGSNFEMGKLNKSQSQQNWWLRILSTMLTILVAVSGYAWRQDHHDTLALITELEQTNKRLDAMALSQSKTQKAAEDTKKTVDEQPTITVKPADTTDPTSKPVLVVQPKLKKPPKPKSHKKGDPPASPSVNVKKPPALELLLEQPKKKK